MPQIRPFGLALLAVAAGAAELAVGPGQRFQRPSQAAAAAHDGDTVLIAAGVYAGDVCTWRQKNLTIRGVGGLAHMQSGGKVSDGKAIWVLTGEGITVENIEFSGAACADRNGAGIRFDAGATVRGCYFHDNQNGVLSGADPARDLVIEQCEFANNGRGDGQTHNVYIGKVRSLTFRGNYSHHAKVGHCLKTRAMRNLIVGNRLMDEATGNASFLIDVPNGGLTFILGNLVQKGPKTDNHGVAVNYGEEGAANPVQRLFVINNTMVNDCPQGGVFVNIAATTTQARVENNIFIGSGEPYRGPVPDRPRNLVGGNGSQLADRAAYDYRLPGGSPAIDAGTDPGSIDGQALLPTVQYVHPRSMEPRKAVGAPDLGAWEYGMRPASAGKKAAGEADKPPPPPKAEPRPTPRLADAGQKDAWIRRLRTAVEAELAARHEPQFVITALGAQATLRELAADGTMVVSLAGTGDMTVPWVRLADRDRANLAVGMARRNLPQLNALAACFLLLAGDEPAARTYLMKSGEASAEIVQAFSLAD